MTQQEFDQLPEISAMEALRKYHPDAFFHFKDKKTNFIQPLFDKNFSFCAI